LLCVPGERRGLVYQRPGVASERRQRGEFVGTSWMNAGMARTPEALHQLADHSAPQRHGNRAENYK
jgi:hypothetical protein